MFSNLPPGFVLLFKVLLILAPPLVAVLAANHFLIPFLLPRYVQVSAYILALPVMNVSKRSIRYLQEGLEIRRLGARRVPRIVSRWPGNVDVLRRIERSLDDGYLFDWSNDYTRKYGSIFNIHMFGEDKICTSEPSAVKAILATDFDKFEKGEKSRKWMQSVLGSGVFNSDGDMWKFHRGMTRPYFVRERVTHFESFDKHSAIVIAKLKERFLQGEAVDFQDIMSRFTLDSATEFLFGSCVNSLAVELSYAHNSPRRKISLAMHPSDEFGMAFARAQRTISMRAWRGDFWPIYEFWGDKTRDDMEIIDGYISPILKDALEKRGMIQKLKLEEKGTLLDHLIDHTKDRTILKDEILNIMIAGRDTTMAALNFAAYCLSQHPKVLSKLREEILNRVGASRAPNPDDIRDCRYLRAVINETLRLYPSVPGNARRCNSSTVLPASDGGKPYYVPADAQVAYSVWIMHRRTDLWGPDAEIFDPDRFIDERLHKYITPNPYIFVPFNAGPRICLGQQFAYNEVSFMLIRLMQAFDTITLDFAAQPPGSLPPVGWRTSASGRQATEQVWPKANLTLYAYGGLWLRMRDSTQSTTMHPVSNSG